MSLIKHISNALVVINISALKFMLLFWDMHYLGENMLIMLQKPLLGLFSISSVLASLTTCYIFKPIAHLNSKYFNSRKFPVTSQHLAETTLTRSKKVGAEDFRFLLWFFYPLDAFMRWISYSKGK